MGACTQNEPKTNETSNDRGQSEKQGKNMNKWNKITFKSGFDVKK